MMMPRSLLFVSLVLCSAHAWAGGIECTQDSDCDVACGETCSTAPGGTQFCLCTNTAAVCKDSNNQPDNCSKHGQSIAPCDCKSGGPTCNDSGCMCSGDYKPTLRLTAVYDSADNITFSLPVSDADLQLPTDANGSVLSPADVRQAVIRASQRWSNVQCCPGLNSKVKFVQAGNVNIYGSGPNDANPTTGGEPACNYVNDVANQYGDGCPVKPQPDVIKRIWAATPADNGHATTSVPPNLLAQTLTTRVQGTLIRSRMIINGAYPQDTPVDADHYWPAILWRIGANSCTTCYDLETVLTHELGHFIGYQHSACSLSILFAQYTTDVTRPDLSVPDIQAFCGQDGTYPGTTYNQVVCPDSTPPVTNGGTTVVAPSGPADPTLQGRHGECASDSECQAPYKCASNGSCDLRCLGNNDCFQGETCDRQLGGFTYCRLLAQGATGATGGGINTTDFCAPCSTHSDCLSGVCVQLASGSKICSAYCSTASDCGSTGTCTSTTIANEGVCVPTDMTCVQSAANLRSKLNEACSEKAQCAPGLLCVQLPQAAVCLEECSTGVNPQLTCSTAGYTCYQVDADRKLGVCFKGNMREGDSCLVPDTSQCGLTGLLLCAGTPAQNYQDAACYRKCSGQYGNSCASGQTCYTDAGAAFGVCRPLLQPTCQQPLGALCAKSEECGSGLCATLDGQQVCTRACDPTLQSGCPAASKCEAVAGSNSGYCFPTTGQPVPNVECTTTTKKGCGCNGDGDPGSVLLVVFAVLLSLRFTKRRGLAILATLFLSATAQATVHLDLSGPELVTMSDAIVHARVVSVSAHVTKQARVYTDVVLQVIEGLKGANAGEQLKLSYPGGRTAALGMFVSGQVSMVENTECVVYLQRGANRVYLPAAMRLGYYDVRSREYDGVRVAYRTTEGLDLVKKKIDSDGVLLQMPPRVQSAALGTVLSDIRKDIVTARAMKNPLEVVQVQR